MKIKELFKITSVPVLFASLCCFSPLVLVALGLSTVSFATSLSDTLYGDYKWLFRILGLVLLGVSLFFYFRKTKNICTFDEVKKRRNEIINITAISVVVGVIGYVFFLYVVVHYAGVFYKIWN